MGTRLIALAKAEGGFNVVEEIRALDLNAMTPIEALNRLAELQRRAEKR